MEYLPTCTDPTSDDLCDECHERCCPTCHPHATRDLLAVLK